MKLFAKNVSLKIRFDKTAVLISAIASLLRLVQGFNFSPMGGIALFSGSKIPGSLGCLLPLYLLFFTDLLLIGPLKQKGFDSFSYITIVVYGCFLFYVLLGKLLNKNDSTFRVISLCFIGSLQFFLVTNFAVWLGAENVAFSNNVSGLLECYINALPFFGYALMADLIYSLVLFKLHAFLINRISSIDNGLSIKLR